MNGHFEGWYYKHQANGMSLALIPGRASDGAFVLVVTDDKSYHIQYPLSEYHKGEGEAEGKVIRVGENVFSPAGVKLDIRRPELTLSGEIAYADLTPIRYDIMGPFRFFPMECRHGIVSMMHSLSGTLTLDGQVQDYSGGKGYIESDSGKSFPKEYTWLQCNDFEQDCSVMVSVALIPFYGLHFWGCICVVLLDGREYLLATYKGAKIISCGQERIELKQGKYRLSITVDNKLGQVLPAPQFGKMSRHIRETLSCTARIRFTKGARCLFEGKSDNASFEYMM